MSHTSLYLLAYDIADDRRRAKIARLMESVSARVQESLFEAYLTHADLEDLLRRVKKVLHKEEDSLRIYGLCEACRGKIRAEGVGKVTAPPGVQII